MSFGSRLAYIREREGLLQKELAHLIGMDERTISDYERGEYYPKFNTLPEIARALNVSLDFLLGVNEDIKSYEEYQVIYLPSNTPKKMRKEIEAYVDLLKPKYKIE